jgi:hypothetical protein
MTPREKAIKLRTLGYAYSYISAQTGLSKSTLSYHLREVPYTPNSATIKSVGNARAESGRTKARQKKESFAEAKRVAKFDIGRVSNRDLFMLGLGLYIGEGSKTQDIIRVVNTDYRVINIFIRWLCSMGFTTKNFTVRIHLYPESNIREAQSFWSMKTGLPQGQFQKSCIDRRALKDRKRSGKHTHGTAHVTVRSNGNKSLGVTFSRRIGAWMEEVLT